LETKLQKYNSRLNKWRLLMCSFLLKTGTFHFAQTGTFYFALTNSHADKTRQYA